MRFKHLKKIPLGRKGEISYIREEFLELIDAHQQGSKIWQIIEAADILIALGKFLRKKVGFLLLGVILLAYLRMVYKPIRNKILDYYGVSKSKQLGHVSLTTDLHRLDRKNTASKSQKSP
jgi:hypothetical protein